VGLLAFEGFGMGATPQREDIPPWLKVPEDLQEPEVFKIQTHLLEALFGECRVLTQSSGPRRLGLRGSEHYFLSPTGAHGSRIPYIEEMSKVMLELKALESSEFTEVLVYGSYLCKFRTRWMLESMAQCHLQQQEQGEILADRGTGDRFTPPALGLLLPSVFTITTHALAGAPLAVSESP
jgi:hypothetical protein